MRVNAPLQSGRRIDDPRGAQLARARHGYIPCEEDRPLLRFVAASRRRQRGGRLDGQPEQTLANRGIRDEPAIVPLLLGQVISGPKNLSELHAAFEKVLAWSAPLPSQGFSGYCQPGLSL